MNAIEIAMLAIGLGAGIFAYSSQEQRKKQMKNEQEKLEKQMKDEQEKQQKMKDSLLKCSDGRLY